jgi:hypothetical protein
MEETRNFLDGLALIPRQTPLYVDSILLALLSKSIVLTEAIVTLASGGFGDEAFGLCRTCIEVQLTVRYLTNADTAQRTRQYHDYFAKTIEEWTRLISKYYPGLKPKSRDDAVELQKLAEKYPDPNKWSKQGQGLRYFATEFDTSEKRDDGSPLTSEFYYEVLYKWMSYYVHAVQPSTPTHITVPGDRFKVHRDAGTSQLGNDALRVAFLSVHINLMRVLRYFNMIYPEELMSLYDATVQTHVRAR